MMRVFCVLIVMLVVALGGVATTQANPVLDNVSQGVVSVEQISSTTTVNQASQQAILHWKSFNIQQGERTHFQQPAGGVALNRIDASQGASQIYGQLTSTGKIILTNSAGIYFGPSAYVNVGGMIASTTGISNENFLNGHYHFDQFTTDAGMVINQGTIIAAEHGLVALLGNGVQNDGTIEAKLGTVALATGDTFTMSFSGTELVSFAVDGEARRGVTNTGKMNADGGNVLVKASTASEVLDHMINLEGVIEARSVYQSGGSIIISGKASHGVVRIAGKLNTSGKNHQEKGGRITVTGHHILLDTMAELDVSGDVGAGAINIGGSYQGKGPLEHANAVVMLSGSNLYADAIHTGDGGTIILWSDYVTKVYGKISARGGDEGGNGGFIETSSKGQLDVNGIVVNTYARSGQAGTWLLDPADLTITNVSVNVKSASPFEPTASGSMLDVATLTAALASNDVVVQTNDDGFSGNGDIIIDTAINYTSAFSLTLSAYRNISSTLSNAIINNSGAGNVILQADNAGNAIGTVILSGTTPNITTGGSVTIYYNPTTFGTQDMLYVGGTSPTQYMLVHALGNEADTTTATLASLSNNAAFWSGNFALSKDIDAANTVSWDSGSGWLPIAYGSNFTGKIDGLDHTISGLRINRASLSKVGFISQCDGCRIANLSINGDIVGDSSVGGFVGYITSFTLENLSFNGTVSGHLNVGGLVGETGTGGGSILSSSNSASIIGIGDGGGYIGGLVGSAQECAIESSYNTGSITAGNNVNPVGGLVGAFGGFSFGNIIESSYNTGSITVGNDAVNVGGLAGGILIVGSVNASYNTGSITAGSNAESVGGLAGNVFCFASTCVEASSNVGSILIESGSFVGGIVGHLSIGVIQEVMSLGNITVGNGSDGVGGVVGFQEGGSVDRAYHAGAVIATASTNVGGLVGSINGGSTINNSFWDTDRSGQADGFGSNSGTVTGLNGGCLDGNCTIQPSANSSNPGAAVNLSEQATYPQGGGEWDFASTWGIIEDHSYPYLQVFYPAAPRIVAGSTLLGVNQTMNLVTTGTVLETAQTAADGSFYFLVGNNVISGVDHSIADAMTILVYGNDGEAKVSLLTVAPASGGSLSNATGLSLSSNTLNVLNGLTIAGATTALGGLSSADTLYSINNNALTVNNGFSIVFDSSTGEFNLEANVATNNGDITFNSQVMLATQDVMLSAAGTGDVTFNDHLRGPNSLTISDADQINVAGNIGDAGVSVNDVLNSFSFTANQVNFSAATNTVKTTNNMLFYAPVSLSNVSVNGTGFIIAGSASAPQILFNEGISGNVNANITLGESLANSTMRVNGAIQLNNVQVTGMSGVTNTLTLNTGTSQTWTLTGIDVGNVTGINGMTGAFTFSQIHNLAGGNQANTFVFSDNALLTGAITAGSLVNMNTLNYAAYTTPVNVIFPTGINNGMTKNSASTTITRFSNINNLIGNFNLDNYIDLSQAKFKTIVVTGIKQGYIDDPTYYYGFIFRRDPTSTYLTENVPGILQQGMSEYLINTPVMLDSDVLDVRLIKASDCRQVVIKAVTFSLGSACRAH